VRFLPLLLLGCTGGGVWIRANTVGYLPDDPKIAIVASDEPLSGRAAIGRLSVDLGPDEGAWGPFRHHYRVDFTALREPGRHTIRVRSVELDVLIDADAYRPVEEKLRRFLQLQRCGDNPVTGKKCHQKDGVDADLVGGWHDAGDGLKHMITTSWCAAALFLAGELDEARWGAAMIRKLHPTLYVQVADDRDHAGFRLWHEDKVDYGFGAGRPGWKATGKPEGPKYRNASTGLASLAGRCAAVMALAGDLETAKAFYRLAKENPGCAQSVPVQAPYYYGERTFHDDLEWAAVELHRATRDPKYLEEAVRFAHLAHDESWMGRALHGHYEFFPYVNLAHWRLHEIADEETRRRLATYYRNGLEEVRRRAESNPWRLGTPLVWCSTNNAVAFATQALLYERMTGDRTYRTLAAEARDWIFGRNPWGAVFVGVRDPHHPFGAQAEGLVDGPLYREINRQFEKYFAIQDDPLARFQSDAAVYHDHRSDFSTNEPILDGSVSLLFLLRSWRR
jgi:hypothetical protein